MSNSIIKKYLIDKPIETYHSKFYEQAIDSEL